MTGNVCVKLRIMLLGLIVITAMGGINGKGFCSNAKVKIGVPKMGQWYKSYDSAKDPKAVGDGVTYTIKWKKVRGADGYQVQKFEIDGETGHWYKYDPVDQKKCSTSISFSSVSAIKAKVRAYKNVNGKRIYGKWSKTVKKTGL